MIKLSSMKKWSEMTLVEKAEYFTSPEKFLPLMLYLTIVFILTSLWAISQNLDQPQEYLVVQIVLVAIATVVATILFLAMILYKTFMQEHRDKDETLIATRMNRAIAKSIELQDTVYERKPREREIKEADDINAKLAQLDVKKIVQDVKNAIENLPKNSKDSVQSDEKVG